MLDPDIKKLLPFESVSLLIVKLAIRPPVNKTLDPVMSPLPFTLNFEADIKKPVGAAAPDIKKLFPDNECDVIVNPPILPAVAVIVPAIITSPDDDKKKLLEDI